jgi:hypothetical protein
LAFIEGLETLYSGPLFWFAEWPNLSVPKFGAGVYTVSDRSGLLIYAGMSGRSITQTTAAPNNRALGLYTRLHSLASGKRSGDQFCVYVADRLVLSTLSPEDIRSIASGRHSMDLFVRRYIHEHFGYRFFIVRDGASAFEMERSIRTGAWGHGKPLLNPGTP